MSSARTALFRTVPEKDYLGFWAGHLLRAEKVVDFLEFKKIDVAKIAGVSLTSVRFDQKIPKQVRDRLMEIATLCELVAQYFREDVAKTTLWFKTTNPLFGNISPREMIRLGRYDKLHRVVMDALLDNTAPPPPARSNAVAGTFGARAAARKGRACPCAATDSHASKRDCGTVPPLRRAPVGFVWLDPAPGF